MNLKIKRFIYKANLKSYVILDAFIQLRVICFGLFWDILRNVFRISSTFWIFFSLSEGADSY